MSLKDLYEKWTFRHSREVNTQGGVASPREQASGTVGVDFLPNEYQSEVRVRPAGDKTVSPSPDVATNTGTFTEAGLSHYATKVKNTLLTMYRGRQVHKFNPTSGRDEDKYLTSQSIKDTPGAKYFNN